MRVLGWIFVALAVAYVFSDNLEAVRFYTLLGSIHLVGANIIRAIQKGAE